MTPRVPPSPPADALNEQGESWTPPAQGASGAACGRRQPLTLARVSAVHGCVHAPPLSSTLTLGAGAGFPQELRPFLLSPAHPDSGPSLPRPPRTERLPAKDCARHLAASSLPSRTLLTASGLEPPRGNTDRLLHSGTRERCSALGLCHMQGWKDEQTWWGAISESTRHREKW